MTWVWGLGPELLPVKRRLPAGRWGPVFRLTVPGKRVEGGSFYRSWDYHRTKLFG